MFSTFPGLVSLRKTNKTQCTTQTFQGSAHLGIHSCLGPCFHGWHSQSWQERCSRPIGQRGPGRACPWPLLHSHYRWRPVLAVPHPQKDSWWLHLMQREKKDWRLTTPANHSKISSPPIPPPTFPRLLFTIESILVEVSQGGDGASKSPKYLCPS